MKINNLEIRNIFLHITEKCDLACPHCFNANQNIEISYDEIIRLLFSSSFLEYENITISGGEPFLHSEIDRILSNVIGNLNIFTNGLNIKKKGLSLIRDAISNNNINTIQISIDGLESNKATRGVGYKTILESIEVIKSLDVPLVVSSMITKQNLNELCDLYEHLNDLNVDLWRLSFPYPTSSDKQESYIEISFNETIETLTELYRMKTERGFSTNLFMSNLFQTITAFPDIDKEYDLTEIPNIIKDNHPCNGCSDSITIKSNGNCAKCDVLGELTLFNVQEHNWNLKKAIVENSEKIISDKFFSKTTNSYCLECRYIVVCMGGCIGNSYRWLNDLDTPDPIACSLFSKSKNLLKLLGSDRFVIDNRKEPFYSFENTAEILSYRNAGN